MTLAFLTTAVLLVPTVALAAYHGQISPRELVEAIKNADPVQLDGVVAATVTMSSVRVIWCVGSDEEPTEFECVWQTQSKDGWITHKSWLAVDGKGWHFID